MSAEQAGTGPEGLASRRAAYRALRRVHAHGTWSSPAVDAAIGKLGPRDRAFAANLAFETLRWEGTLDWALDHVLKRPDVEDGVRDVLRLGAWQLAYGQTPPHAAVATAVEVARAEVGQRATGFVNGVLRALARRWDELPWPDEGTTEGLGLTTGYEPWIVAEARARFRDDARAVLEAGNAAPGVTLRAGGDPDALVAELAAAGLPAERGAHAAEAVRAPGAVPGRLPAVAEGRATPQDEASMLVVEALLAAAPDAPLIYDVCAAPGGKATHLTARGRRVLAGDHRLSRARLISELAQRLGLPLAVVVADGLAPPVAPASLDAVLLDVPCTGLGVVRRRPELRWRRSAGDPAELARLQGSLVDAAVALLRPGGVLCYSACTWTIAETTSVVGAALARHPELRAAPVALDAGWALPEGPGILLRPDHDGTDGMYVAILIRDD